MLKSLLKKKLNNPKFIDIIMPFLVIILIALMFLFTFSCVKTSQSAFRYNIKVREKASQIYQIFLASETNIKTLSNTIHQSYDTKQINNQDYNKKFLLTKSELVKAIILESPYVESVWIKINTKTPNSSFWYTKSNGKLIIEKKDVYKEYKDIAKQVEKKFFYVNRKNAITIFQPLYKNNLLIGFVGIDLSFKEISKKISNIQKEFIGSNVMLLNEENKILSMSFGDMKNIKVSNIKFLNKYLKKVASNDNIVVYQERWGQNTALIFKMKNNYKIVMSCPNQAIYPGNTRILEAIYLFLTVLFLYIIIFLYNRKKIIMLNKQLENGISTQKIILNSSPMGIAIKDTEGNYIESNNRFAQMLGVDINDIIDKNDYNIFDKDTADFIISRDDFVKSKNDVLHEEDWFTNKVGKRFLLEKYRIPLFNSENELMGLLITISDVTKRREEQESLQFAKEAAEKATKMKSSFLANMSHEIRTPLNGILGFLQLLENTDLSETQGEFVSNAQKSSEILLNIINEILDISKIEAGKMSIDSTSFNIRSAVEDVTTIAISNKCAEGININSLIRSDVPQRVLGDPSRVKQILNNLIGNAIKFTKQGEVIIYVNKILETAEEVVVSFQVRDTGIGIPKDKLDSIFGAFVQADASTTRNFGGTGLGLAISKKLANLMNGDISVVSEVNKGSTFTLTLPFAKDLTSSLNTDNLSKNLNGITVLVIDDKPTDVKIISHYINDANGFVIDVNSIEHAIDILRRKDEEVSVVLVDAKIQKSLDFDLSELIKKEYNKEIPLILYTSITKKGDAILAKQKGFTGYLTKPIKKHELLEGIAIAVNGFKQSMENKFISKHLIKETKFDSQAKILVVEDSELNVKLILNIFKNINLNCDVAINGKEAIRAFKEKEYDVILMDCELPEVDGYEATKKIRLIEGVTKHTPIIAMTANVLNEDREKCYEAGMDNYLSKPININDLYCMLGKYVKIENSTTINTNDNIKQDDDIISRLINELSFSKEDACEIFDNYIEAMPQTISHIENEINNENYERLSHVIHKFKGASANLRVDKIVQICDEFKMAINEKNIYLCRIKADEIKKYFEELTLSFNVKNY